METTSFKRKDAEFLAEIVKKKQFENVKNEAKAMVEYLLTVYEERIKKEIEKNPKAISVDIIIPRKLRVKKDISTVKEILDDTFRKLGFEVSLLYEHCGCLLNFVCNYNGYYVRLFW